MLKSPIGGAVGAVIGIAVVWLFFVFLIGNRFDNNSIYNPIEVLSIAESSVQFRDASCGKQVVVLATITNNGDEAYTDIVFDVEFFDESGKLVDTISDTEFDLVITPGSTKSFKVMGKSGTDEAQYASHKITVAKAELDVW